MCPYKFELKYEEVLNKKKEIKEEFFDVPNKDEKNLFKWFKKLNQNMVTIND